MGVKGGWNRGSDGGGGLGECLMNVTKLFEKMWTLHVKGKSFSLSTFFETLTFLAPMAGRKDASFSSPAPPLSRS
jgi:hypothetical protein